MTARDDLKTAPKITQDTCQINWNKNAGEICRLIAGLSPYPGAFTTLLSPEGKDFHLKIHYATAQLSSHDFQTGWLLTDRRSYINVAVKDGFVCLKKLQLAGKTPMTPEVFLNGFPIRGEWRVK